MKNENKTYPLKETAFQALMKTSFSQMQKFSSCVTFHTSKLNCYSSQKFTEQVRIWSEIQKNWGKSTEDLVGD